MERKINSKVINSNSSVPLLSIRKYIVQF